MLFCCIFLAFAAAFASAEMPDLDLLRLDFFCSFVSNKNIEPKGRTIYGENGK